MDCDYASTCYPEVNRTESINRCQYNTSHPCAAISVTFVTAMPSAGNSRSYSNTRNTSGTDLNTQNHCSKLYQSFKNAKETSFQCAIGCSGGTKGHDVIFDFVERIYTADTQLCDGQLTQSMCNASGAAWQLKNQQNVITTTENMVPKQNNSVITQGCFKCYYNPSKTEYVYFQTHTYSEVVPVFIIYLIFTIIGGILDLVIILDCMDKRLKDPYNIRSMSKNVHTWSECLCQCLPTTHVKENATAKILKAGKLRQIKTKISNAQGNVNIKIKHSSGNSYPIEIAAGQGHSHVVTYLASEGAKCLYTDKENTVLCKVCAEKGSKSMIETLIKQGSPGNKGYPKSPLSNLIENNDLDNVILLVSAGYNLNKDKKYQSKLNKENHPEIYGFLMNSVENPTSLQNQCRICIRRTLGGVKVQHRLSTLATSRGGCLPNLIVKYLQLDIVTWVQHYDSSYYNAAYTSSSESEV